MSQGVDQTKRTHNVSHVPPKLVCKANFDSAGKEVVNKVAVNLGAHVNIGPGMMNLGITIIWSNVLNSMSVKDITLCSS
jgi:hypothetical protein